MSLVFSRIPCGFNLGTSEIRLKVVSTLGSVGTPGFRPSVSIVQDGVVHGCTGPDYDGISAYSGECTGATGLGRREPRFAPCNPFDFECINPGEYASYMTRLVSPFTTTLALTTRFTTFDPDRSFTLRVRGNWLASVPDLVLDVPGKDGTSMPVHRLPADLAGLWWNPAESGWGLLLDRNQRGILFAAWLTYDDQGESTWFVMPNGQQTGDGGVEGAVLAMRGRPFSRPNDADTIAWEVVGTFRFTFTDDRNGEFRYVVNGRSGSSPMQQFVFRSPTGTVCSFQNWPGVQQVDGNPGWAAHVGGAPACGIHATLLSYDDNGRPMWVFGGLAVDRTPIPGSVPTAYWVSSPHGALYRPTGTPYALPWNPSRFSLRDPIGNWLGSQSMRWSQFVSPTLEDIAVEVNGTRRVLDFQRFFFEY